MVGSRRGALWEDLWSGMTAERGRKNYGERRQEGKRRWGTEGEKKWCREERVRKNERVTERKKEARDGEKRKPVG